MKISLIVAASENDVIGDGNTMLWHIPEDFKYFKATTMGKPIIMGRKTYDSIGRPLPGRLNIVISRNADWKADGTTRVGSLEEALKLAESQGAAEAMVIGGAQIYAAALPFATSVYLTRIHKVYTGEATFPKLATNEWKVMSERKGADCAATGIDYDFLVYERVR
ncbi:MAG: dihydrofolate reductase [Alphaproteobacteria bacterium]|nr:dihydrofolate reductase [Alphaproteobacteria bacterium]